MVRTHTDTHHIQIIYAFNIIGLHEKSFHFIYGYDGVKTKMPMTRKLVHILSHFHFLKITKTVCIQINISIHRKTDYWLKIPYIFRSTIVVKGYHVCRFPRNILVSDSFRKADSSEHCPKSTGENK